MNKPHKWAKEIKAWADGEKVEYRKLGSNEWRDEFEDFPYWDSIVFEYRIKPQPKDPQYLYVCINDSDEITFETEKDTFGIDNDLVTYIGKIKLEVDNE